MLIRLSRLIVATSLLFALSSGLPALAGPADVVAARLSPQSDGRFTAEVTVSHADTGWEHYADLWEVLTPEGDLLGACTLFHPHVEEQPFTRSLRDIEIPPEIETVVIRARDSLHGFGGAELTVEVPR